MVKMRLKRMGQKKAPFYRIVVADSRSPRDGRFIEEIGYYDPNTEPSTIKIDEEAAKKWLSTGAQPTETVGKLLKIAGIPYRNSFFLVLWWNTCIPIQAPTEPPMHANPRRVFSLVRHSSFFAFHLSWPNARNVIILITQR